MLLTLFFHKELEVQFLWEIKLFFNVSKLK